MQPGRPLNLAFSAVLCRGLIEADDWRASMGCSARGFPRFYAAASLKRPPAMTALSRAGEAGFPRFYAAASLKLSGHEPAEPYTGSFSAVLCRGLIEATAGAVECGTARSGFPRFYAAASLKPETDPNVPVRVTGFPRFYAAASLKPHRYLVLDGELAQFSAVLCRGLIEAADGADQVGAGVAVFRGFMPRPH